MMSGGMYLCLKAYAASSHARRNPPPTPTAHRPHRIRWRNVMRKLLQWKVRNPETKPTLHSIQSSTQLITSGTPLAYRVVHVASRPAPSAPPTRPVNRAHSPRPPAYREHTAHYLRHLQHTE